MISEVPTILRNIVGFTAGNPRKIEERHSDIWRWFKHCFGFLGDIPHVLTLQGVPAART
jgi:hypothetical protein